MPQMSRAQKSLQLIAQATEKDVSEIDDLFGDIRTARQKITTARRRLAAGHLIRAKFCIESDLYRPSINASYYSMYHTARAAHFWATQGVDFDNHTRLPGQLSKVGVNISNDLMNSYAMARLSRNEADYDIFPLEDDAWEDAARDLYITASTFISQAEAWFR